MKTGDELIKGLDVLQKKLESVEQLESTYSQVSKALCGKENATVDELLQAVDQLKSRLAQVERERDAALNDLKDDGDCYYCKHRDLCSQCYLGVCVGCDKEECPCCNCDRMNNNYEWRGVCPENTKEE